MARPRAARSWPCPYASGRSWACARSLVLAVTGSLALTIAADPLTGGLHVPFPERWAALAAWVAIAAHHADHVSALGAGRWCRPSWCWSSSASLSPGGAVAPPLLPPFYAAIGRWLPNGATTRVIRDIVYFGQGQHIEAMVVEAAWLAATFGAVMLVPRFRRRTSSGRPR